MPATAKRPAWKHKAPHCLTSIEFSVWWARVSGCMLTVTRFKSGGMRVTIERRRASDGGYDTLGGWLFPDAMSEEAARAYCEARVHDLTAAERAG